MTIHILAVGVFFYGSHTSRSQDYFLLTIVDKTHFSQSRVKVFAGSQDDVNVLQGVVDAAEKFDVIIDDGSHVNRHQIESFEILFPPLRGGGIYVIEDTQTSYWPSFGGGNTETPEYENSCMRYFLRLGNELNYGEFLDENFSPSEYSKNIIEISFHHNMIVVVKGSNDQVPVAETRNVLALKQSMDFNPEEK